MEEEKKLEQRRIKDFNGWLQLIRDKRKVGLHEYINHLYCIFVYNGFVKDFQSE